jgi:ATP-dependent phosphoenolpyruvate carboxykinase
MLDARGMWPDNSAYDHAAADLAARFRRNFEKFTMAGPEVRAAAPGS